MNFTDDQRAFEYALYMIASSWFDRSVCLSKMTEANMLLQYREQRLNTQYRMEEICIRYMEGLENKLPVDFFRQKMEVRLRHSASSGMTEILFSNERSSIAFRGIYLGNRSRIRCRVHIKSPSVKGRAAA